MENKILTYKEFKEKYNLKNKNDMFKLLFRYGKIFGYANNKELWLLPDKYTIVLKKNNFMGAFIQYNKLVLNGFRKEFFNQKIEEF